MKSPLPTRIGRYPIVGLLGRGGMGIVYEAVDAQLDRRIAIKVLAPELATDPGRLERFRREARVLAALNHPGITSIFGLEETGDGGVFIVMEELRGESLRERLDRGPLPWDESAAVLVQLAEVLEAAHGQGIIHRDLKPENVFCLADARIKVLDFGLARSRHSFGGPGGLAGAVDLQGDPETAATLGPGIATLPGVIMGTPGYMSPEQVRGLDQDERTDLFAAGCILYECLTGCPAFPGDTPIDRVVSLLEHEPDWTRLPDDAPPAVRPLISRCLEKSPEHRPASAAELRRLLLRPGERDSAPAVRHKVAGNVPATLTALVGRVRETEEIKDLLARKRLVTLTGAGGSGKTRLALHVAERILSGAPGAPQYAWFVDFSAIQHEEHLLPAIAAALGIAQEGSRPLIDLTGERLAYRALLILDNCEHLLPGVNRLAAGLLSRLPDLKILATSREPLGVPGEQIFLVPTLALPGEGSPATQARAAEAVELFENYVRLVNPGFEVTDDNVEPVTAICRRLDGIPLALELAAARARVLSVTEIAAHLEDALALRAGPAASDRHRTLRDAIAWSFNLLNEAEAAFFSSLAVFAGSFGLDAVEAVGGEGRDTFEVLDLVMRLVDKSLLIAEHRGKEPTRYRLLDTIRQYARERLEKAGRWEEMEARHRRWFCDAAERAEPELTRQDQEAWLKRLDSDHENLLAAIERAARAPDGLEDAERLGAALWRFWYMRGHYHLGKRVLARLMDLSTSAIPEATRGGVAQGLGVIAYAQGEYERAIFALEQSLESFRAAGVMEKAALAQNNLGNALLQRGEYARAETNYRESLAVSRELGRKRPEVVALANLGIIAYRTGRHAEAVNFYEDILKTLPDVHDPFLVTRAHINIVESLVRLGRIGEAQGHAIEALRGAAGLQDKLSALDSVEAAVLVGKALGSLAGAFRIAVAVRRCRDEVGLPLSPAERATVDAWTEEIRAGITDPAVVENAVRQEKIELAELVGMTLAWLKDVQAETR